MNLDCGKFLRRNQRLLEFKDFGSDEKEICREWEKHGNELGPYEIDLRTLIMEEYLNSGQYVELFNYCERNLAWQKINEFPYLEIRNLFLKKGDRLMAKRFWTAALAKLRRQYNTMLSIRRRFDLRSTNNTPKDEKRTVNAFLGTKDRLLDGLRKYRADSLFFGSLDCVVEADKEIAAITLGRSYRRKIASRGPASSMEEAEFWSLIEKATKKHRAPIEQVDELIAHLSQKNAEAIMKFDRILQLKLNATYTWDMWAIAFLSQGGCTETEFDNFRSWIILQGKGVFSQLKKNYLTAKKHIPKGLNTHSVSLSFVAETAYRSATGTEMQKGILTPIFLKGTPWEEEELASKYPSLAKFYK